VKPSLGFVSYSVFVIARLFGLLPLQPFALTGFRNGSDLGLAVKNCTHLGHHGSDLGLALKNYRYLEHHGSDLGLAVKNYRHLGHHCSVLDLAVKSGSYLGEHSPRRFV